MTALARSLLCLIALLPQQAVRSVPVGDEPRHHVVYSNDYVRVIDAVVPPGDVTLYHTHSKDNVPVAISGGKMRTQVLGGEPTESDVPTGGIWFARETYTHQITNVGEGALRFIDAEILATPPGSKPGPALEGVPGLKLEIDNPRVRVYRVRLESGQSTGEHTHSAATLCVAITAASMEVASGGASRKVDVKAGGYDWHAESLTHSLSNTSDETYEGVEIEWK